MLDSFYANVKISILQSLGFPQCVSETRSEHPQELKRIRRMPPAEQKAFIPRLIGKKHDTEHVGNTWVNIEFYPKIWVLTCTNKEFYHEEMGSTMHQPDIFLSI